MHISRDVALNSVVENGKTSEEAADFIFRVEKSGAGNISVIYSRSPLIRMFVIRIANYPYRVDPAGKFVANSTKLTYLEITRYQIKYSTVLWLTELQIRCGLKV